MNILKDFSVHFLFHSQGGIKANKYVYKQTQISDESERLCFGGAPHIFQIRWLINMSGKVQLLKIWATTTTLLMWPWPVRMVSEWKLTRWSWLGRSFILIILQSTSAVGKRLQLQLQLPHVPPTQVPVGVDGLASLAEDRKNLFPDQVAQLLELRGNNSLLSLGRWTSIKFPFL